MRLRGERGNILEIMRWQGSRGRRYVNTAQVAIYAGSGEAVPLAGVILAQEDVFDLYGMFDAGAAAQLLIDLKSEPHRVLPTPDAGGLVVEVGKVGFLVEAVIEKDPEFPGDPVSIASHWSLTPYAEGVATAHAVVHLAKWQGNVIRNWLNSFVYQIIDEAG